MKYIKQFGIILTVTCVGEILKYLIPLPIPGSIYGLVLLLPLCVIVPISTCLVMFAAGKATDIMIEKGRGKKNE